VVEPFDECFGVNPAPREMVECDFAEFLLLDADRVDPGGGRDLVADGDDGVEVLFPSDIDIGTDLIRNEHVPTRLHFDERHPVTLTPTDPDQTVRTIGGVPELEGDLDEGLDDAGGSPERRRDCPAELAHRPEHGKKGGAPAALLFVRSGQPGDRDDPGRLPDLVAHRHDRPLPVTLDGDCCRARGRSARVDHEEVALGATPCTRRALAHADG